MPSSMIFAGLVVIWLLILLPAVARHRQEVPRPSESALAGRVLDRPRRPESEVDELADTRTDRTSDLHVPRARTAPDDVPADDRGWDRPPPRYRPGRGGYDPQAAAAAARARAVFRQRVVLTMLLLALVSGVIAAAAIPVVWSAHAAIDVALVGYLVYLRRQVRMEEAIRARRAARLAAARRASSAADDPAADEWARRGREVTRRSPDAADAEPAAEDLGEALDEAEAEESEQLEDDEARDDEQDDLKKEPEERISGTGGPAPRLVSLDELTIESALPRLEPAPPPPLPAGTVLVEELDDELDQHDLGQSELRGYRRAAGE